jgi:hypothetical protein
MIETPEGKFYTVPEVAKILGYSFQYVRKLINGRLRKYQSYKIYEKPVVDQSLVLHVRKENQKTVKYLIHENAVKSLVEKKLQKIKNNALILS